MSDTATEPRRSEDTQEREGSWLDARMDGRTVRSWLVVGVAIAAVTIGFGALWTYGLDRGTQMASMDRQAAAQADGAMGTAMSPEAPRVPPVFAYYDRQPIAFIHTEASDEQIAQALEGMMGSPVPVVESLAQVPDEALGNVYVFANGVKPDDTPLGPLGFQPDVFDSAPGDAEYTPLRRVVEVTWSDDAEAEVLTSVEEITSARSAGELTFEPTDVVVNAPLLTWPRGQR